MSEFSKLTTKLITPLLKKRGFKKRGPFDRGTTHDFALYSRGDTQVRLTYAFHPYDYPDLGIHLEVRSLRGTLIDRLQGPRQGGVRAMLRAIAKDLESSLGAANKRERGDDVTARLRRAGGRRSAAPHHER